MVPFWNFRGLNNQLNDEMFKGKFNDDHYRRFESYEEIPENEKSWKICLFANPNVLQTSCFWEEAFNLADLHHVWSLKKNVDPISLPPWINLSWFVGLEGLSAAKHVMLSWWLRVHPGESRWLHSGKLTWQWKIHHLKMYSLLKSIESGDVPASYVRLLEGTHFDQRMCSMGWLGTLKFQKAPRKPPSFGHAPLIKNTII